MLRLLHTSDVQLGAPFHFLGESGAAHRAQLRDTFRRIVDVATDGGFDVLLIAGDLFDGPHPTQSTIDFVIRQVARVSIPVCILPGNHDPYQDGSVYATAHFPPNVHILQGQPSVVCLPALDLTIYANATTSAHSRGSPMRGLAPTGSTRWHVALAHGNLVRPDVVDPPRPITPDEIRRSGMDYVALGDWHAFADYSQGPVKACYSGSPEPVAMDQRGAGFVAAVDLAEGGVHVRRHRIGTVRAEAMTIDLSGRTVADALAEIEARADTTLMLTVTIEGLAPLGTAVDPAGLEAMLANHFHHVRVQDQTHPEAEAIALEAYPETLILGRFVRLMGDRIADAEGDSERRRLEQALQLGVALLEGRSVL